MYFKGIDEPDTEPRRNRYAAEDRKTKFTEKVAEKVTDGDLYFSMRAPSHQRFYVPVEAGEHGMKEAGLLCVTHVFYKPFPDIDGRWKSYGGGGNLVIKIDDDRDLGFAAMRAIEQALYTTPLGRAVGRDTVRGMAESLCQTFGINLDRDEYEASGQAFRVNLDQELAAKNALRELLSFAPETGYDERLGEIGADADGVGFAENAEKYAAMINGRSDGFDEERDGNPLPFLSQPVFYAVLGYKGNGRSFQARLTDLMQAVGLSEDDLR